MNNGDYRLVYQWTPLFPVGEWWQFALVALTLVTLTGFWIYVARREARQGPASWVALAFRILPLSVLFLFCLNPQRISELRRIQSSEVAILLDTSLSMNLSDQTSATATGNSPSRYDQVLSHLRETRLLQQISQRHDASIFSFDETTEPRLITRIPRMGDSGVVSEQWVTGGPEGNRAMALRQWTRLQPWLVTGLSMVALGLSLTLPGVGLFAWRRLRPARGPSTLTAMGRSLLLGTGLLVFALGWGSLAAADLLETNWSLAEKLSSLVSGRAPEWRPWSEWDTASGGNGDLAQTVPNADRVLDTIEQRTFPEGTETRLGDNLASVLRQFSGRSLAGVVVVTDGNQNQGTDPAIVGARLAQARIPLHVIGVGQQEPARNAMLVSLDAPAKVLPKSPFSLRGFYRTENMEGETCRLDLCLLDSATNEVREILESRTLTARADPGAVGFEFELQGAAAGRTTYLVRLVPETADFLPVDDSQLVEVAVVERKNRILLIAGGPSREFRFLRNQLYRDPMVVSDVWLQSLEPGADQEANEILTEFPDTMEALDQYDCVIAFDPDWTRLNPQKARHLEQWVSIRGGGLISIAGPVFTPEWSMEPRGSSTVDPIRRLYPVSFFSQGSAQARAGRFGGEEAFPLEFTREGTTVDYLSVANDPLVSRDAWNRFPGVYGYYAVNEAKPGAQILAYFSDPNTMMGQRKPIYLASQFVGKGRVFFQASGEMWRIRRQGVEYFQTYYTKLVRWASQGRLLRDSQQGNLVVDRTRCWVGDTVTLQAQLWDRQGQPLAWPEVEVTARLPSGTSRSLTLDSNPDVAGEYRASLALREEGPWRFFLPVPGTSDGTTLQSTVSVQLSDLEKRESQQNVALLTSLASMTKGQLLQLDTLESPESVKPIVDQMEVRQLETIEPGMVDRVFSRRWLAWILGLFSAYFCLGWIYRRMNHLA